jgi:hypothetical protein
MALALAHASNDWWSIQSLRQVNRLTVDPPRLISQDHRDMHPSNKEACLEGELNDVL